MILALISSFILAVSLSVDSFAVSACSAITLKDRSISKIALVAVTFGLVQGCLLVAGWLLGDIVVGYVEKVAHVIGALLLGYVGGSMILDAWRGGVDGIDLNDFRNILLGGVATSIDALAVGVSFSMDGESLGDISLKAGMVAAVTMLSSVLGIMGGSALGARFGRPAVFGGGVVLVAIGVSFLVF
jgi:putative Mn2+ efflux pump MntP